MPTIAQELQSIGEWLEGQGEMDDPNLTKRRRQLYEMVCAVKTWQDGNTNKRIVKVCELQSLFGEGPSDWIKMTFGKPDLWWGEDVTLSWTEHLEWPFVKVTLTNGQDKDDCFKWNSERMEAP